MHIYKISKLLGNKLKYGTSTTRLRNVIYNRGRKLRSMTWLFLLIFASLLFTEALIPPFPLPFYPPVILLDRDGVINVDVGSPGVLSPNDLRLTPSAGTSILRLHRYTNHCRCRVVVVTNQSCVGKGLLSLKYLDAIHLRLESLLVEEATVTATATNGNVNDDVNYYSDAIPDRIHVCTSIEDGNPRKKPNPGMLLEALCNQSADYDKAVNTANADPSSCVMIGDTISDLMAAHSAGIGVRVLVSTGYGKNIMGGRSVHECGVELIDGSNDYNGNGNDGNYGIPVGIPRYVLPFYYVENLKTAVTWIIGNKK